MFKKEEWAEFKAIFKREGRFDWDISMGYLVFGSIGMTVCKLIRGKWVEKHVNGWREKSCTEVNKELREQKWLPMDCPYRYVVKEGTL